LFDSGRSDTHVFPGANSCDLAIAHEFVNIAAGESEKVGDLGDTQQRLRCGPRHCVRRSRKRAPFEQPARQLGLRSGQQAECCRYLLERNAADVEIEFHSAPADLLQCERFHFLG
jgi:hypothetical protein